MRRVARTGSGGCGGGLKPALRHIRAGWASARQAPAATAICLAALLPLAAHAQPLPPMPPMPTDPQALARVVQMAAHNQLGMAEYCLAQGSVGPETVDRQRRVVAALPQGQAGGLDTAAYAAGRKGTFQVNGVSLDARQLAASRNMTVDEMCRSMAATLRSQADQIPR